MRFVSLLVVLQSVICALFNIKLTLRQYCTITGCRLNIHKPAVVRECILIK